MKALKQFTGGGSSGGGGSQSQLISLAMAEATKLFDGAGGASSGNKQDAVNSAAMTVMKLLVQSKFSGTTGGGNSGGLGSLMGMVRLRFRPVIMSWLTIPCLAGEQVLVNSSRQQVKCTLYSRGQIELYNFSVALEFVEGACSDKSTSICTDTGRLTESIRYPGPTRLDVYTQQIFPLPFSLGDVNNSPRWQPESAVLNSERRDRSYGMNVDHGETLRDLWAEIQRIQYRYRSGLNARQ